MFGNNFIIFFFISVMVFWCQPFCNGATHWIVTEDGRIQQQVDSIFNLKRPYDLVTFIQQQETFDRMKMLRDEYLEEKKKVIEAREKERQETKGTFYKMDPDCIEAGRHISEFELQLDTIVSFADKGINIADHINLCQMLSTSLDPPLCQVEFPFTMHNYDHLRGVSSSHEMNHTVPEPGLVKTLPHFDNVDELGSRLHLALEKKPNSWVLLNLAAYYWRIKGNGLHAVECLRRALYYSPREHKDRALMSLAAVLYHANHALDSVTLIHASLEITSDIPLHHLLLGNVYSSLQMYEMAELCYKFVAAVTHDTKQLCQRIKAVRCALKLKKLLEDRQLAFDEKLDSLTTPELNDSGELGNEELSQKKLLPLETFKIQLNHIHRKFGGTSDTAKCHNNVFRGKQEPPLSSKHVKGPGKGAHVKQTNDKIGVKDKELNHQKDSKGKECFPERHSQGMVKGASAEAALDLKAKMDFVDVKNHLDRGASSKATEHANNAKGSLENKTMKDFEETFMASGRGAKVIREKNANKMLKQQVSADSVVESTNSEREVQPRTGKLRQVGKRGESGLKKRKNSIDSVFLESVKIPRLKGDFTTLMYEKSRSPKDVSAGSKNARDIFRAKLFEEAELSPPRGPKHTPPLESREAELHQKNCKSYAGKKRKGDVITSGCWSEKTSAEQSQGSVGDVVVPLPAKSSASKAEFFEGLPVTAQFSGESLVMKQTVAGEISSTAAVDLKASAVKSTSETTLRETTVKEVGKENSPKDGERAKTSERAGSKGGVEPDSTVVMSSKEKTKQATLKAESPNPPDNKKTTPQTSEGKKAGECVDKVGAGANVFETSFMNVNTDGSVYDLDEEKCGRVQGIEALIARNKLFSAWLSLETKDVNVQAHIDFRRDVDDLPKRPRCNAKIKKNPHTFDDLQGVMNAAKLEQVVEAGLTRTLLSLGGVMQSSVDEMGTRIFNAMKKNSTSWVLLNIASLYWRILGDTTEAIKCLRQALYYSPATTRDVAQVSLASILLREGRLEDTTVVIKKALEISPTLALGHFILGNVFGAQNKIAEAIQHYLLALQLEPGFSPAMERLKIIQCVLWRQQKDLEREADELRKLLPPT